MNSESKSDLNQLIQKCLKKDRNAQQQLYEGFGPLMKVVCRRYLFDTSKIEEVMNQGFLKVFIHLKSFKNEGSFEGWVRRIMVNTCLNENRKKNNYYSLDPFSEDAFFQLKPEAEQINDADYILRIIDSLPLGYKTIFNLIEIEGFSYEETSKEMNISQGACRTKLSRAKELLRQKLNKTIAS